ECFTDQFDVKIILDKYYLRVATRNCQTKKRKMWSRIFNKMCQNMRLHMIYLDQWEVACQGKGLRKRCSDKQRADRKSTRLNSSHVKISYAVFCLKKKR